MGYPAGPLLQALAGRIRANLEDISGRAPPIDSANYNHPPFADTQLLISLLGVLVFPHERTPGALGKALLGYPGINEIVRVRYSQAGENRATLLDEQGREETIDASKIDQLPRLLRNSIAHFNVLPLADGKRFGGIRVWNERKGEVNFVADISFDDLRPFAIYMLETLERGGTPEEIGDPIDPLERLGLA